MCGIIGWLGSSNTNTARLEECLAQLTHRGPDAQIVRGGDSFGFGHSLLSIIGESPIQQPIVSSDGKITLTYNGEIYNYLELMKDDPKIAARCRHRSDTEVLVEGLSLYGIEFAKQLNGIFAFTFFDKSTGAGYLVRDRLGVKPLYYTTSEGNLYFSSEIKPLLKLSGTSHELDPESLYSYVRFRYPLGERTYYRSIKMLPPGSWAEFQQGTVTHSKYWQVLVPEPFEGNYQEACEVVKDQLEDAIRIQMRSDHSFCTYLSGGLDSSYLTAIARRTKEQLDSYSIGLQSEEFDESEYAQQVASYLNTRHHPYLLTKEEYRSQHESFVDHLASPISVPNQVAMKVLSRELSKDHRCVLSGEGADEVFGGYGRIFLLPYDWQRLVEAKEGLGAKAGQFVKKIEHRHGRSEFVDYVDFFVDRYGYVSHQQAVEALRDHYDVELLNQTRDTITEDFRQQFGQWETDPVTKQLLFFQKNHLPGLLLRVDTATMAHAVEARVPFLDHRLLELLNSMPIGFKIQPKDSFEEALADGLLSDELSETHNTPKSILKDIAEEALPHDIIWRKKMGFPIPNDFYRGETAASDSTPNYNLWVQRNLDLLKESREEI